MVVDQSEPERQNHGLPKGLRHHQDQARDLNDRLATTRPKPGPRPKTTDDFEHLRWFPYPDEVTV